MHRGVALRLPDVAAQAKFICLALAAVLVAVNVLGVKRSGRFQAIVVTLVLFALVPFIGNGLTFVDQPRYHPFFPQGPGGVLAATGFVSYAGVTRIASVAEEVENPGRNIPVGILGSVLVMMLVYTFALFVVVGVSPADRLAAELDCTVLMVHSNQPRRHTFLRYLLERVAF